MTARDRTSEAPSGARGAQGDRPRARGTRGDRRSRGRLSLDSPVEGHLGALAAFARANAGEPGAAWLLSILVVGSVLAVGSVHLPALLVGSAVAFLGLAVGFGPGRGPQAGAPIPPPVLLALALAAYTLAQAIPLPASWVAVLAPANADVWARALFPLAEPGPRWISVSLDPGASLVEALKWTTYGVVFALAARIGVRRGARWGLTLVFISAMAVALVTMAHGLLGARKVFGLYQPTFQVSAWHLAPLLNPNNLAGYLNLGACCGLGLLLSQESRQRWLYGLGVATLVAVEITSASRGGVVSLFVGVVMLSLLTAFRDRLGGRGTPAPNAGAKWLFAMAVGGGSALAALGATGDTWAELYDTNVGKLELARWTKPMLADHLWLGIGRGAFESVFHAYRPTPGHLVFTHAENFVVQWLCEWGLPVGGAAMLAFAWALSPRKLGALRSAPATAGFVGVLILLLQNLFDLALEVPGVCIALTVVLGSLWGGARRAGGRGSAGAAGASPRRFMLAVSAAGFLLCAGTLAWGSRGVAEARGAAQAAYERLDLRSPEERARMRGALRTAMLRYPAEPYFPLVGALLAWRGHDEDPMPWLQRTLERGSINGRAHLLLAEVLMSRSARRQALFELRLAIESEAVLAGPVASTALRWTTDYDELLLAVPSGKAGALVLDSLGAHLVSSTHEATRRQCDLEAIVRDPGVLGPRLREAEAMLAALAPGSTSELCRDRQRCARDIEVQAAAIEASRPRASTPAQLRARLLSTEGRYEEAEGLLARGCEAALDRKACLQTRVSIAARIPDDARVTAAIKAFLGSSCGARAECAAALSWGGDVRTGRGENATALPLYERAAQEDPTEARWLKVADVAARTRAHSRAAFALEKVAQQRGGADEELRRRIQEQKALATGALLMP